MKCTKTDCDNTWNEGDGLLTCETSPCPLRKWVNAELSKTDFNRPGTKTPNQVLAMYGSSIRGSATFICNKYKNDAVPYKMPGSLSAKTTVTLLNGEERVFRTTQQQHSEMLAIEWMVDHKLWNLHLGKVMWSSEGSLINAEQFKTDVPHCGFCTFFLSVLKLPLTKPTYGLFQISGRLSYILPPELEVDSYFMARVLASGDSFARHEIKRILNGFVPIDPSSWVLKIAEGWVYDDDGIVDNTSDKHVIEWDALVYQHKREVLYAIWKYIFDVLLNVLKDIKRE